MDSSVSGKDGIWFLRVCHHVPHELYTPRVRKPRVSLRPDDFKSGNEYFWLLFVALVSRTPPGAQNFEVASGLVGLLCTPMYAVFMTAVPFVAYLSAGACLRSVARLPLLHIAHLRQECHNSKFGIFELLV